MGAEGERSGVGVGQARTLVIARRVRRERRVLRPEVELVGGRLERVFDRARARGWVGLETHGHDPRYLGGSEARARTDEVGVHVRWVGFPTDALRRRSTSQSPVA